MEEFFTSSDLFIFAGGLGSGKTEIAANTAFLLSTLSPLPVYLIDLDTIKPYYRSRHLQEDLTATSIKLVAPPEPYIHADLPILTPEVKALLIGRQGKLIVDLGGDDAGARVLGFYQDELEKRKHHFLYVINISRPHARELQHINDMMAQVERSSRLRITGIINNTHLLWETTEEVILEGAEVAREIARMNSLPLLFHCVKGDVKVSLPEPVLSLRKLYFTPPFIIQTH
ncbi:MAG: hypothetical protein AB2L14_06070 [Candidatus Xenobiia bacterium LiM19]